MAWFASHRWYGPLSLTATALLVAPTLRAEGDDFCVECHLQAAETNLRQPAEQVSRSAHRHPSIGCVGCHGGDSKDPTVRAHAAAAGYVGKPLPSKIAALCGGCHGDAELIRRLNAELPLDQLVLFGASRHGELTASGDAAAPTCTTCHGHHDTLPASEPRSRVHPRRVAELCASCHADPAKMAAFRIPTTQLSQWQRSAHAAALDGGSRRCPPALVATEPTGASPPSSRRWREAVRAAMRSSSISS